MASKNSFILPILTFVSGAVVGAALVNHVFKIDNKNNAEISVINEIHDLLSSNNVDVPDNDYTRNSVINGYLASLGDRYALYSNYDTSSVWGYSEIFNESPIAVGCGFSVAYDMVGVPYINNVIAGGIADAAGLKSGDVIISVDNYESDPSDSKFLNHFYGGERTKCTVKVKRLNTELLISFNRHNDDLAKTLYADVSKLEDINYIRLGKFSRNMFETLINSLDNIDTDHADAIIDLRNKPGGDTGAAVDIAAFLGAPGNVYFHSYFGNDDVIMPTCEERFQSGKIVVLVNENTKSSGEILTSLLKQYKNATIVGEQTYGKGVYQLNFSLSNGGRFRYTDGYYTVGEWESYNGIGITPDIEVSMNSSLIGTDDDIQLKKALELLQ